MFQFYIMWLHLFFNILLPLAVLAFFNRAIYTKLHQVENNQCLMIGTFTLQFPERLSAVSHGSRDNLNRNHVSSKSNHWGAFPISIKWLHHNICESFLDSQKKYGVCFEKTWAKAGAYLDPDSYNLHHLPFTEKHSNCVWDFRKRPPGELMKIWWLEWHLKSHKNIMQSTGWRIDNIHMI